MTGLSGSFPWRKTWTPSGWNWPTRNIYGWAFENRAELLPTRAQIARATEVVSGQKKRLLGRMEILFVTPDYYSDRPKPCMNGWATRFLTVNPIGDVLPCPTASAIKGMRFDNVRERALSWIWTESDSFNRFRGTDWMPAPCCECPMREIDFGGCRCQAALITGDANATDPACSLTPTRNIVDRIIAETANSAANEPWVMRQNPVAAE